MSRTERLAPYLDRPDAGVLPPLDTSAVTRPSPFSIRVRPSTTSSDPTGAAAARLAPFSPHAIRAGSFRGVIRALTS